MNWKSRVERTNSWLFGFTILLAFVVALATFNPFNYMYLGKYLGRPIAGAAVVLFLLCLSVARVPIGRKLQVLLGGLSGLMAILAFLAILGSIFLVDMRNEESLSTSLSSDGKYELAVFTFDSLIDPAYEVRIRTRQGLFSKSSGIFLQVDGGPPKSARFVGPREVEIVSGSGEVYRSTFNSNLDVKPFHCVSPGYC